MPNPDAMIHPPHDLTTVCGNPLLSRFTVPGGWLYRTIARGFADEAVSVALMFVPEPAHIIAQLVAALDPDALEDIARDLVGHGFGTTVESLRGIAAKQRTALAKATGETR